MWNKGIKVEIAWLQWMIILYMSGTTTLAFLQCPNSEENVKKISTLKHFFKQRKSLNVEIYFSVVFNL